MMNESNISTIFFFDAKDKPNASFVPVQNNSSVRQEITEFIQTVNFWISIVEIVMVICGIVGNGLALIVINRRSLRDTSSSVFITYLAIFDLSILVVHVSTLVTSRWIHSYVSHCLLTYLTDLVTFCSVWIIVIMTLERCVAVRSPFLAKRYCTTGHARSSVCILVVVAFVLFSSTFPFIYTIDKVQQKCGVRSQYQKIIRFIKPTIFYFVPDLLLLANLFVIYELFKAKRQRQQTLMDPDSANNQLSSLSFNRKQQQLTIMLVTVSLSFYVFTTPAVIDYIRQMHPPKHNDVKRLKRRFLLTNLSVLWLQMSSATNFVFYCLAGSKFRAVSLETMSDVCDFIRAKLSKDETYTLRRRRQTRSDIHLNSTPGRELPNGAQDGRRSRRSSSIPHPRGNASNNRSQRRSRDTIASSQFASRQASRVALREADV